MAAPKSKKKSARKTAARNPQKEAAGVCLIGLAVILLYFSFAGGTAGLGLFLRGVAGYMLFALALVVAWIGLLLTVGGSKRVAPLRVLGIALLVVCLFSFVHLFVADGIESELRVRGFLNFVNLSFEKGTGAGAIGAILSWPLYSVMGAWGTGIALVFIVLMDLVLMRKISVSAIAGHVRDHVQEYRAMPRENRQAKRDIPIGSMYIEDLSEGGRSAGRTGAKGRPQTGTRDSILTPVNENTAYTAPARMSTRERAAGAAADGMEIPTVSSASAGKGANPARSSAFTVALERAMADKAAEKASEKPSEKSEKLPEVSLPVSEERKAEVCALAEETNNYKETVPSYLAKKTEEATNNAEEAAVKPSVQSAEERPAPRIYAQELPKIEPVPLETTDPEEEDTAGALSAALDASEDEDAYNYPPIDLLAAPKAGGVKDSQEADAEKAQRLEDTLRSFGVETRLTGVAHGPAVTRFELKPAPGIKVSRITSLADDIAMNLAAVSVRMEAPIPGKDAVGVEVPNDEREFVQLREVLESQEARKNPSRIAVGLGKDNAGRFVIADIAKMPHVLIAGATGSGKSVCINSIICSILYRASPAEVRLILIDPKVVELSVYNDIPHLLVPVVTDPRKAASALQWAVCEMTDRYKKFAAVGARNIKGYNAVCPEGEKPMPQIVIIIDELADLMLVAPGEVEDSIQRLTQLARAAGIHLVIATQRPSVNVITGVIKANIPVRIAFQVASQVDSRTILDAAGAEKLLGNGDMLYATSTTHRVRVQGAWVSDDEVQKITQYIIAHHETDYNNDVIEHMENVDVPDAERAAASEEYDELLPRAIEIVIDAGQASISMLQRKLKIGYARAGRLIDDMDARGIVSPSEGAKPREVLMTREQFHQMFGDE